MKLERSPRRIKPGSWKRVVWYVILLIVLLILMWQMPAIVERFFS